jgi:hypothetical protein
MNGGRKIIFAFDTFLCQQCFAGTTHATRYNHTALSPAELHSSANVIVTPGIRPPYARFSTLRVRIHISRSADCARAKGEVRCLLLLKWLLLLKKLLLLLLLLLLSTYAVF